VTLPGLFVVGTDTGVGKTEVAAAVARALVAEGRRVGVLKPVATGATHEPTGWTCDDARRLIAAAGADVPLDRVTPIGFEEPLAPSVAARRAGRPLTHEAVLRAVGEAVDWWSSRADVLVVEGVGGLLCPLAEGTTVADLAIALDYPLVIVARRGLGTLNHTLLTVEAAHRRALRIAGVVLNSPEPDDDSLAAATNAGELAARLEGVAIVAELPHADQETLSKCVGAVDWYERARPSRRAEPGLFPV
jgi:dethiobiotin synthetase